ncbi:gamma-glutamylcyclotransferase [Myxococcota bacterium]|nr:gamma-glutamylcyclotransferase [Myxococcota bacterium]
MARAAEGPEAVAGEELLVVYGSLMRGLGGASGEQDDLFDRLGVGGGLRRLGECHVAGRLYDLGPYPALRPARAAGEIVRGELHAVLDPAIWNVLDAFEGFDPADRPGSDYLRERIALQEPRALEAWIYVYNREPDARCRIGSGDWRAHLAKRADRPHVPD